MRIRSDFAYCQSRMQARHGARLADVDWKSLEGAQTLSLFLERARTTSLRRFLGKIDAAMTPAAIERALRLEALAYCGEIAYWLPPRWRPAFIWLGVLPQLPLLGGKGADGAALSGEADPLLASFAANGENLAARWHAHWQSLWPRDTEGGKALLRLAAAIGRQSPAMGTMDSRPPSTDNRSRLIALLIRTFRGQPSSPVAVAAHIGLALFDLERLRGGLVRRRLFSSEGKAAP